jgi:Na+/proline symporter/signal transduction histidine kinase/CheY-like chemotaxis protein
MIAGWVVLIGALAYLCALFAVAFFGDRGGRRLIDGRLHTAIYALSLGIYCTSWTFFGSVGLASTSGIDFLPIYIGPILVIGFGHPLTRRIVRLTKAQNITSVADFVAARFGKAESVAALVAVIAVIGAVPYVALQLKAVSSSLAAMLSSIESGRVVSVAGAANGLSLLVAFILAGFAIAFGTRRIDATEHQDGLMLAIATESVVKIIAFTAVGAYVTFVMFDGFSDLTRRAVETDHIRTVMGRLPDAGSWVTMILVSAAASILLPRQFHVTVVENRNETDVAKAAWLFPLYLIAINVFVLPIAIAGLVIFPEGAIDRDMTVLALPLHAQAGYIALLALIGGLSAATAMVIVASVAVSIMVSNDLVMPAILRGRLLWREPLSAQLEGGDLSQFVLAIRRIAILVLLLMSYAYYRTSSDAGLAAIGLLSFAAVAQIAPVFIGGLIWTRATSRGALAGLSVGLAVWTYTLFLPSLNGAWPALQAILNHGPLGLQMLRPTALFGLDLPPLVHGVFWSLSLNAVAFVAFSFTRPAEPIERLQANIFVGSRHAPMAQAFRLWRATVTIADLEATVARYLGPERTGRAFESFRRERGIAGPSTLEADAHLLRFAEHLLASAIGAASSRLVLSLLLRRRNVTKKAALKLLDNASVAIQHNRDLLQHALDHARQGITVFDRDFRLVCWNREFRDLFNLPNEMVRVGIGLDEIIRFNAERGIYGNGPTDQFVTIRMASLINDTEPIRLRVYPVGGVIEIRSARMPDGGLVTTYTDVSNAVKAEEALEATNETLERRVRERTEELVRLNVALGHAKAAADEANLSKTRFLAAASHDILQPLNAARLYASSLLEQTTPGLNSDKAAISEALLAHNVNASLEAIEEILTAILDISRLDAGAMKPEFGQFQVGNIFNQLQLEFEPLARSKGLALAFVGCTLVVRSDRRLLRRLLQNLVSNAIKYTQSGRVLVGCRRTKNSVRIEVWDTGPGIPIEKQKLVFQEFQRLDQAAKAAPGLGLGLSIVERIGRVLGHTIGLRSAPGRGSLFTVEAPRAIAESKTAAEPVPMQTPARLLSGMTILAIDNEPRVLDGTKALLSAWGCNVVTALNSDTALTLQTTSPDAVIADYHLDNEDGIEVISKLRRHYGRHIPAVLATADRSAEMRQRAHSSEIVVLNKPLKPAALRSLLAQWQAREPAV